MMTHKRISNEKMEVIYEESFLKIDVAHIWYCEEKRYVENSREIKGKKIKTKNMK